MMNRRQLLATGAALPILPATTAFAQEDEPTASALADAQRFHVGEVTVMALSDGALHLGPDVLQGIDAEDYATLMEEQFRDPKTYLSGVNAWLVDQGGGELTLIDAGAGGTMGGQLGRMMDNLAAAGIMPGEIIRLVATHLHPDHVGGMLLDGEAAFPDAELVVPEADRAYWSDDANVTDGTRDFFRTARAVLDAYADRLSPISGETEVTSAITSVPLPGHTPGHTGYRISSGGQSLLIWGDIVHVAPVQLARPDVAISFDVDPDKAAETRARILDRVAADRTMVAGSHIEFPGLGNIAREGRGFRLVAAPYPYPT